jgi:hypothetical protein
MKKLALVLGFSAVCSSATAHAHFNLVAPPPNTTTTDGGMGSPPCGVGTPSGMVTPAQGGHTITLNIDEYVPHTGFYRIALAMSSPSELPLDSVVKDSKGNILPPSGKPGGTSSTAAFEDPPVFPVLYDHLFQHTANGVQTFKMDITLPNVSCDKCTLQVLEFMADHGFNTAAPPDTGPGGGYFYRHCADLKITADPALPPMGSAGAGGGSAAGGAPAVGGAGGAGASGAPNTAGGAGGMTTTGGQSSASAGASVGGSPGGAGVVGSGGASPAASSDNGGCSCSLGRQSHASLPIASLLLGLLVIGRGQWRRRARAST